jgi:hypothetical protein
MENKDLLQNILYKLNKYKTRYEMCTDLEKKNIYEQKIRFYINDFVNIQEGGLISKMRKDMLKDIDFFITLDKKLENKPQQPQSSITYAADESFISATEIKTSIKKDIEKITIIRKELSDPFFISDKKLKNYKDNLNGLFERILILLNSEIENIELSKYPEFKKKNIKTISTSITNDIAKSRNLLDIYTRVQSTTKKNKLPIVENKLNLSGDSWDNYKLLHCIYLKMLRLHQFLEKIQDYETTQISCEIEKITVITKTLDNILTKEKFVYSLLDKNESAVCSNENNKLYNEINNITFNTNKSNIIKFNEKLKKIYNTIYLKINDFYNNITTVKDQDLIDSYSKIQIDYNDNYGFNKCLII